MYLLFVVSLCVEKAEVVDEERALQHIHLQHRCMEATISFEFKGLRIKKFSILS